MGVVQVEAGRPLQVGDAFPEVGRRPANGAVHLVALGEKELRQVRTVLARDAGDQRFFLLCHIFCMWINFRFLKKFLNRYVAAAISSVTGMATARAANH